MPDRLPGPATTSTPPSTSATTSPLFLPRRAGRCLLRRCQPDRRHRLRYQQQRHRHRHRQQRSLHRHFLPGDGGNTGAFAGDGGLIGASGAGSGDTAINFGNDNGFGLGPAAVDGTGNFASDSGDTTGTNSGALAGFGNDNIASVDGGTSSASAGGEYGATTPADLGNNDIAYVLDPSGADGSSANAGFDYLTDVTGNSDLAAVFGVDGVTANAVGADGLTTILPALGAEATTGSSFLADLFPSLGESAASSSSNFLTDLLSLF